MSSMDQYQSPTSDLRRCELCVHGTACRMHNQLRCGYAHSLAETLPPRELEREYRGVWTNGVDIWYGQSMPDQQKARIKKHFDVTPPFERPVWSVALNCFFGKPRQGIDAFPQHG